jgi:murein DD-endopeptidase MepM/ murein hydrolase activator NlpD
MTLRAAVLSTLVLVVGPAAAQDVPTIQLPVDCTPGLTCMIQNYVDHDAGPGARDYACGEATYDGHDGTDFRLLTAEAMRQGVAVRAALRGRVVAARDGMPDDGGRQPGDKEIKGRECGNGVLIDHGGGWETQYCHLQLGSVRARKGDMVLPGQQIGLVGLSGLTQFPHLHLTVRKDGMAVDPFASDGADKDCGGGPNMWSLTAAAAMPYVARAVLNAGFTARIPSMDALENGDLERARPAPGVPVLAFYVRTLHLKAGDAQEILIKGPDGKVLAESKVPPLDRSKAQYLAYAGIKLSGPLAPGVYRGVYRVTSDGKSVLEREESVFP